MLRPLPPRSMAACSEGGPTSGCGVAGAQVALEITSSARKWPIFMFASMPDLELAAVGGAPRDFHLDPQVALVREADFERGGFGDDGGIGFDAREHVAGAEAAILLVGHGSYQHIAAQGHT